MGAGRPYKFTPKEFDLAWQQYFEYIDNTPWIKHEAIKSGDMAGKLISIPVVQPYTEVGFCAFHNLGEKYISDLSKLLDSKEVKTDDEEELTDILTQARARCKSQKFAGAAVGAFNASIIARDLGLVDKKETEHTIKIGKQLEDETYE